MLTQNLITDHGMTRSLCFLGVTQEELEMIDEQIKKNIFTDNNKGRIIIIRVH